MLLLAVASLLAEVGRPLVRDVARWLVARRHAPAPVWRLALRVVLAFGSVLAGPAVALGRHALALALLAVDVGVLAALLRPAALLRRALGHRPAIGGRQLAAPGGVLRVVGGLFGPAARVARPAVRVLGLHVAPAVLHPVVQVAHVILLPLGHGEGRRKPRAADCVGPERGSMAMTAYCWPPWFPPPNMPPRPPPRCSACCSKFCSASSACCFAWPANCSPPGMRLANWSIALLTWFSACCCTPPNMPPEPWPLVPELEPPIC